MIKATILADSVSPAGHRITTWELTHPRMIHSEFLRHRMLAVNAASSRTIPIKKMLEAVLTNPALFEQYGKANTGMSAQELMDETTQARFIDDWTKVGQQCAHFADLWKDDAAKQMVNRALEPWSHMTVIVTGTDWHNFYALRAHPAAMPEFQVLAYRMLAQYLDNAPESKVWGEWHLPLVYSEDYNKFEIENLIKISAGRCARVSYNRQHDGGDPQKDIERCDGLIANGHMSPTEHPACAQESLSFDYKLGAEYHGCFKGWKSYRKFLPNENRTTVDLHQILADKPEWVTLQ